MSYPAEQGASAILAGVDLGVALVIAVLAIFAAVVIKRARS
jgi:hypothetical protein